MAGAGAGAGVRAGAGVGVRFGAGAGAGVGGQGSGEAGEESQGVAALDGPQVLAQAGEAERRRLAAEQRDAFERVTAGWDPDERRQFARYLIRCRQDNAAWSAHQHQKTREEEEADDGGGAGWRQHAVMRFASW